MARKRDWYRRRSENRARRQPPNTGTVTETLNAYLGSRISSTEKDAQSRIADQSVIRGEINQYYSEQRNTQAQQLQSDNTFEQREERYPRSGQKQAYPDFYSPTNQLGSKGNMLQYDA